MEVSDEVLYGWGLATHARSRVYRPTTTTEVRRAVEDAREDGLSLGHRGAGQSYGDAALNQGGALLAMSGLDGITAYEPTEGVVRAEAGVTIDRLWRTVIEDGWWLPVVPGTSRPTVGGCAAANIHGKNHWKAGTFGDHVCALTVLGPDGSVRRIRRSRDPREIDRHLGGLGLTGTILAVTLDLKRIYSGYLEVEARAAPDLPECLRMLDLFSEQRDYAVAWLDCFARDDGLGRAELHGASYLPADHPTAGDGLSQQAQVPDSLIVQSVPGGLLQGGLDLVLSDIGMRGVNAVKYTLSRFRHPSTYLQPHAAFHFLLDYIPGWRRAYEPGGLIQYQFFVPEKHAEDVFRRAIHLQQEVGVRSYLGVMKRHREQPQADSYSVNGYSLALDFPVYEASLGKLMTLVGEYDRLQRRVDGRIYGAKDLVSRIGRLPRHRRAPYASNLSRRWSRWSE